MKRVLSLIFVLWFCLLRAYGQAIPASSGINVSEFDTATTTTLTTLHIGSFPSQINFCLAVGLITRTGDLSGGAVLVWDGTQTMTAGPSVVGSGNLSVKSYYLIDPHTGTHNLTATWANAASGRMVAVAFAGADQSTCIDPADNLIVPQVTAAIWDHNITSTADGATVAFIYSNDAFASIDTGTSLMDSHQGIAGFVQAASYMLGGTSNEHKFTTDPMAPEFIAGVGIHIIGAFSPPDTRECQESYGGTGYFGCKFVTADSQTIAAAGALNLGNQAGGCWFRNGQWITADSPEGGVLGILQMDLGGGCAGGTQASISGTVTLSSALAPGMYHVFLRIENLSKAFPVDITVNGVTSNQVVLNSGNGGWTTTALNITLASPSNTITINVYASPMHMDGEDFILRALYVTSNLNKVVNGSSGSGTGVAVDLTYNATPNMAPDILGNLVPNGSFETGIEGGAWGQEEGRKDSIYEWWDNTGGHSGSAQLKIPLAASNYLPPTGPNTALISKVFHLEVNKKYTVGCWVRSELNDASNLGIVLTIANAFVPPAGYHAQFILTQPATGGPAFVVNTSWQQITITDFMIAYPTVSPDFWFSIRISHASANNYLYIDDCMLQQGTSTTYVAAHPVETQIAWNDTAQPGHVFFTTDARTQVLRSYNNTGGTLARTIDYQIFDYLNRPIAADGTVSATIRTKVISAASGVSTDTISLAVGSLTGAFRFVLWQHGENDTMREGGFSVIPPN